MQRQLLGQLNKAAKDKQELVDGKGNLLCFSGQTTIIHRFIFKTFQNFSEGLATKLTTDKPPVPPCLT